MRNMKNYVISVVSYKRPNNNTCNLLKNTNFNWRVFVYEFDPFLEEYKNNYGSHLYIIKTMNKANLATKRQLVLDTAIKDNYKYCFMLDDDIVSINNIEYPSKKYTLTSFKSAIQQMYDVMLKNNEYVVLSASYNASSDISQNEIESYKNICNNSIFNIKSYKRFSKVKYNPLSKCEDMEFTLDLIFAGALMGRLKNICINNCLQGGSTNDGLSYRFSNTNRFIEEGSYMAQKYPEYKTIFEYDENHFKMNTDKLLAILGK